MVRGIVADANIQGQVEQLAVRMRSAPWGDFWTELGLAILRFEDIGLSVANRGGVRYGPSLPAVNL